MTQAIEATRNPELIPYDHAVQFYDTDAFLADSVASYLADGLRDREPCVVIATAAHRELFTAILSARGINVDREIETARLIVLDADETLSKFMVDGMPDRARYLGAVGAVFEHLEVVAPGTNVRAYGEMVDLLWRAGNHAAAIQLEELWNELRGRHVFTLLCAYVMDSFYTEGGIPQICATHSHVRLSERDPATPGPAARVVSDLVDEIARRTELEVRMRETIRQLRRAEEGAHSARMDLEDFLCEAAIAIHRVDRDGIIRWANKMELELLGYSAEEYIGHHITEFHADADVISDILARLTRGETICDYDARLRAKDGSIRHVQINSNVQHRDGEFITTRCFSRDVTAQKQAEADRDAIYRVTTLLSAELELDRVVQTLSKEAQRLCGAETCVFRLVPGNAGITRVDDVLEDSSISLASFGPDVIVRSYLCVPVLGRAGSGLGTLYLAHSMPGKFTAHHARLLAAVAAQAASALENARLYEAERGARAIAERAERRTSVLHALTAALSRAVSEDEAARIVLAEAPRLIGVPATGVLLLDPTGVKTARLITNGVNADDATVPPIDANLPICMAARTGRPVWDDRSSNGSCGAAPIVFEGKSLGAIGFHCAEPRTLAPDEEALLLAVGRQCAQAIERARLHDITQAARAQAEEALRAKDEFLAMLGHELRNPLSPILTAVQLMRVRGDTSSTKEQNIIERQVNHLMHLVDDLLDISRISRGKVQLEKTAVRLGTLISKAVEIASPLLEERRHHFDVSQPVDDIWLEADEIRLCQVFSNLLTNAAKYTEPGGIIRLTVSREGNNEVAVRIKDNGIGIGPDLLPRIFDLFVQGGRGADRRQGGLGIGLALVRNLVTSHGGTVSAASEGLGRGTELTVRLPITELSKATPPDREGALKQRVTVRSRKILIVDDNEDAASLLGEMLDSVGHEVMIANDGPHALELVKRFHPDIAVLDIGLPVMDGYELALALRERFGQKIRLMAVTGYGQEKDRVRAEGAGFDAHFVKPVTLAKLLASIELSAADYSIK